MRASQRWGLLSRHQEAAGWRASRRTAGERSAAAETPGARRVETLVLSLLMIALLLRGFGASLHTWDGWATVLEADYRVIRFELPAAGLIGADQGAPLRVAGATPRG